MAALYAVRVIPAASAAVATCNEAMGWVRSQTLTDEEKERRMRRASKDLLVSFLSISLRGALAVAVSLLPSVVAQAAGLVSASDVMELLVSWEAITLITVVMVAAHVLTRQVRGRVSARAARRGDR